MNYRARISRRAWARAASLAIAALAIPLTLPVLARYASVEVKQVPVARLLKNLNRMEAGKGGLEKARLEYQIGRLHSMAYAQKTENASARTDRHFVPDGKDSRSGELTTEELPFFGYGPQRAKIDVKPPGNGAEKAMAARHLAQAIEHYRLAADLARPAFESEGKEPAGAHTYLRALLGLGWCLDQSGDRKEARATFRKLVALTWPMEKNQKSSFGGYTYSAETVSYLIPLLDRKADSKEIARLEAIKEQAEKIPRRVTPIVIPLEPYRGGSDPARLMTPAAVSFDMEGRGRRRYSPWPGAEAGFLVYLADGEREVHSGLQLFGNATFWLFWQNGYQALAALDDDRNGRIEGEETRGLAIWQDRDGDGRSAPSELKSLKKAGIRALFYDWSRELSSGDYLYADTGVEYEDGQRGASFDWLLREEQR